MVLPCPDEVLLRGNPSMGREAGVMRVPPVWRETVGDMPRRGVSLLEFVDDDERRGIPGMGPMAREGPAKSMSLT